MQLYENILSSLLEIDDHTDKYILKINVLNYLQTNYPDLSLDEIQGELAKLESMKLISTPIRKIPGAPIPIKINPMAYNYFKDKKAEEEIRKNELVKIEKQKKAEKWENRKWNLFQTIIGAILGIVGTILVQVLLKRPQ